jgi:ArsR family transcriptional regulator
MAKKKAFDMERLFQALGDTTRLRLLNLMGSQELCVCYFVEVLGQPQPKISRHLAYLRNAGLVLSRREGTWMHYRIATPGHAGASRLLKETLRWMQDDPDMIADRKLLTKACCSPEKFATLQGAPAPVSCC